jgi:hypothetical protein
MRTETGAPKASVAGCLATAALVVMACNKLSDDECLGVRTEAFDIINQAHTCNDDTECEVSAWPGCGKPVSSKNQALITPIKEKFDKGSCKEPEGSCREPPEVYCKQGLCVFREKPGQENPTAPSP